MSPLVPNGSRLVQMGQHGSQCIALQWIQMGPMGLKGTKGSKNGINGSWWVQKDKFLDRIYFGRQVLSCASLYRSVSLDMRHISFFADFLQLSDTILPVVLQVAKIGVHISSLTLPLKNYNHPDSRLAITLEAPRGKVVV